MQKMDYEVSLNKINLQKVLIIRMDIIKLILIWFLILIAYCGRFILHEHE